MSRYVVGSKDIFLRYGWFCNVQKSTNCIEVMRLFVNLYSFCYVYWLEVEVYLCSSLVLLL